MPTENPPNLLFLFPDQHRPDWLGTNPALPVRTPNIDALARGDRGRPARPPLTLLAGWWYWTIPLVEWIKRKEWGGGQVFDQGTHLIDLMRLFAGDVTSVYAASTRNAIPEDELPNWDANALTLRFAGGTVGSIHSTYALFPGLPDSNGLDIVARELLLRLDLGRATIFRRGAAPEVIGAPDGWTVDRAFLTIVQRNEPAALRATAREGLQSLAVTLAANYSAVTGKVVDLADFIAAPPTDAVFMPNARPVFAAPVGRGAG